MGSGQYLDGLGSLLTGAGVTSAAMAAMFPGWLPLFPDAIPADATIATTGLGTYEAAVQVAQSQAADFDSENTYLAGIEAQNVSATCLFQVGCLVMLVPKGAAGVLSCCAVAL